MRLPRDLHRQLQNYASRDGRSLNSILLRVIEEWWMKQPEGAKYRRGVPTDD